MRPAFFIYIAMHRLVTALAVYAAPLLSIILIGLIALSWVFPGFWPGFDDRIAATLAALLFAVFSFFFRSIQQEEQSRKQHTIKILFDTRLSSEFRQYLEHRKHHFAEGSVIDPARFTEYLAARRTVDLSDDDANSRRKSAEAVRSLLNYYEFIALGIKSGDLDEPMLKGMVRGMTCRLVADAHLVIRDYRADNARTFEHLTALYANWKDPEQPDIE
ncbi:MAG: DUF4760 domain-containing protein [Pseudomonadota bacterium]